MQKSRFYSQENVGYGASVGGKFSMSNHRIFLFFGDLLFIAFCIWWFQCIEFSQKRGKVGSRFSSVYFLFFFQHREISAPRVGRFNVYIQVRMDKNIDIFFLPKMQNIYIWCYCHLQKNCSRKLHIHWRYVISQECKVLMKY